MSGYSDSHGEEGASCSSRTSLCKRQSTSTSLAGANHRPKRLCRQQQQEQAEMLHPNANRRRSKRQIFINRDSSGSGMNTTSLIPEDDQREDMSMMGSDQEISDCNDNDTAIATSTSASLKGASVKSKEFSLDSGTLVASLSRNKLLCHSTSNRSKCGTSSIKKFKEISALDIGASNNNNLEKKLPLHSTKVAGSVEKDFDQSTRSARSRNSRSVSQRSKKVVKKNARSPSKQQIGSSSSSTSCNSSNCSTRGNSCSKPRSRNCQEVSQLNICTNTRRANITSITTNIIAAIGVPSKPKKSGSNTNKSSVLTSSRKPNRRPVAPRTMTRRGNNDTFDGFPKSSVKKEVSMHDLSVSGQAEEGTVNSVVVKLECPHNVNTELPADCSEHAPVKTEPLEESSSTEQCIVVQHDDLPEARTSSQSGVTCSSVPAFSNVSPSLNCFSMQLSTPTNTAAAIKTSHLKNTRSVYCANGSISPSTVDNIVNNNHIDKDTSCSATSNTTTLSNQCHLTSANNCSPVVPSSSKTCVTNTTNIIVSSRVSLVPPFGSSDAPPTPPPTTKTVTAIVATLPQTLCHSYISPAIAQSFGANLETAPDLFSLCGLSPPYVSSPPCSPFAPPHTSAAEVSRNEFLGNCNFFQNAIFDHSSEADTPSNSLVTARSTDPSSVFTSFGVHYQSPATLSAAVSVLSSPDCKAGLLIPSTSPVGRSIVEHRNKGSSTSRLQLIPSAQSGKDNVPGLPCTLPHITNYCSSTSASSTSLQSIRSSTIASNVAPSMVLSTMISSSVTSTQSIIPLAPACKATRPVSLQATSPSVKSSTSPIVSLVEPYTMIGADACPSNPKLFNPLNSISTTSTTNSTEVKSFSSSPKETVPQSALKTPLPQPKSVAKSIVTTPLPPPKSILQSIVTTPLPPPKPIPLSIVTTPLHVLKSVAQSIVTTHLPLPKSIVNTPVPVPKSVSSSIVTPPLPRLKSLVKASLLSGARDSSMPTPSTSSCVSDLSAVGVGDLSSSSSRTTGILSSRYGLPYRIKGDSVPLQPPLSGASASKLMPNYADGLVNSTLTSTLPSDCGQQGTTGSFMKHVDSLSLAANKKNLNHHRKSITTHAKTSPKTTPSQLQKSTLKNKSCLDAGGNLKLLPAPRHSEVLQSRCVDIPANDDTFKAVTRETFPPAPDTLEDETVVEETSQFRASLTSIPVQQQVLGSESTCGGASLTSIPVQQQVLGSESTCGGASLTSIPVQQQVLGSESTCGGASLTSIPVQQQVLGSESTCGDDGQSICANTSEEKHVESSSARQEEQPKLPNTKIPISVINEHFVCKICRGYFVNATTIIVCQHTFCRSCIVPYLDGSTFCPVCEVQLHKTSPMIKLRADTVIQTLLYTLLPHLYHDEVLQREQFGQQAKWKPLPADWPPTRPILPTVAVSPLPPLGHHDLVCFQLISCPDDTIPPLPGPRFYQCSASLTILMVKRLLRLKYNLSQSQTLLLFVPDYAQINKLHRKRESSADARNEIADSVRDKLVDGSRIEGETEIAASSDRKDEESPGKLPNINAQTTSMLSNKTLPGIQSHDAILGKGDYKNVNLSEMVANVTTAAPFAKQRPSSKQAITAGGFDPGLLLLDTETLRDAAYIVAWKRNKPLRIFYKILLNQGAISVTARGRNSVPSDHQLNIPSHLVHEDDQEPLECTVEDGVSEKIPSEAAYDNASTLAQKSSQICPPSRFSEVTDLSTDISSQSSIRTVGLEKKGTDQQIAEITSMTSTEQYSLVAATSTNGEEQKELFPEKDEEMPLLEPYVTVPSITLDGTDAGGDPSCRGDAVHDSAPLLQAEGLEKWRHVQQEQLLKQETLLHHLQQPPLLTVATSVVTESRNSSPPTIGSEQDVKPEHVIKLHKVTRTKAASTPRAAKTTAGGSRGRSKKHVLVPTKTSSFTPLSSSKNLSESIYATSLNGVAVRSAASSTSTSALIDASGTNSINKLSSNTSSSIVVSALSHKQLVLLQDQQQLAQIQQLSQIQHMYSIQQQQHHSMLSSCHTPSPMDISAATGLTSTQPFPDLGMSSLAPKPYSGQLPDHQGSSVMVDGSGMQNTQFSIPGIGAASLVYAAGNNIANISALTGHAQGISLGALTPSFNLGYSILPFVSTCNSLDNTSAGLAALTTSAGIQPVSTFDATGSLTGAVTSESLTGFTTAGSVPSHDVNSGSFHNSGLSLQGTFIPSFGGFSFAPGVFCLGQTNATALAAVTAQSAAESVSSQHQQQQVQSAVIVSNSSDEACSSTSNNALQAYASLFSNSALSSFGNAAAMFGIEAALNMSGLTAVMVPPPPIHSPALVTNVSDDVSATTVMLSIAGSGSNNTATTYTLAATDAASSLSSGVGLVQSSSSPLEGLTKVSDGNISNHCPALMFGNSPTVTSFVNNQISGSESGLYTSVYQQPASSLPSSMSEDSAAGEGLVVTTSSVSGVCEPQTSTTIASSSSGASSEWKEVQLKISECGVMSVRTSGGRDDYMERLLNQVESENTSQLLVNVESASAVPEEEAVVAQAPRSKSEAEVPNVALDTSTNAVKADTVEVSTSAVQFGQELATVHASMVTAETQFQTIECPPGTVPFETVSSKYSQQQADCGPVVPTFCSPTNISTFPSTYLLERKTPSSPTRPESSVAIHPVTEKEMKKTAFDVSIVASTAESTSRRKVEAIKSVPDTSQSVTSTFVVSQFITSPSVVAPFAKSRSVSSPSVSSPSVSSPAVSLPTVSLPAVSLSAASLSVASLSAASLSAASSSAVSSPSVSSPSVSSPSVSSPAVSSPAVSSPAVSSPAVSSPAVSSPAVSSSAVSSSAVSSSAVSSSAVSSPSVSSPSVSSPSVSSPSVSSPSVSSPSVSSPSVSSPSVSSPSVSSPSVSSPSVSSPSVSSPSVSSPSVSSPSVSSPSVSSPSVVSPSVVSPSVVSPSVVSPSVVSPSVVSPSVVSPSVVSPSVVSPSVVSPSVVSPSVVSPSVVSPSVVSPSVVSPSVVSPSVVSPSVVSPSVLSPSVLSPSVLSPSVLSPSVLSPSVLSPSVLSPSVLSPSVLSPSVLSPSVLSPSASCHAFSSPTISSPSISLPDAGKQSSKKNWASSNITTSTGHPSTISSKSISSFKSENREESSTLSVPVGQEAVSPKTKSESYAHKFISVPPSHKVISHNFPKSVSFGTVAKSKDKESSPEQSVPPVPRKIPLKVFPSPLVATPPRLRSSVVTGSRMPPASLTSAASVSDSVVQTSLKDTTSRPAKKFAASTQGICKSCPKKGSETNVVAFPPSAISVDAKSIKSNKRKSSELSFDVPQIKKPLRDLQRNPEVLQPKDDGGGSKRLKIVTGEEENLSKAHRLGSSPPKPMNIGDERPLLNRKTSKLKEIAEKQKLVTGKSLSNHSFLSQVDTLDNSSKSDFAKLGSGGGFNSHVPANLAAATLANLKTLNKLNSVPPFGMLPKKVDAINKGDVAGGHNKPSSGRKSQSIGYKTLNTSPKGWNPTISREHIQMGVAASGGGSTTKTNKFFKARNAPKIFSSLSAFKSPSALVGVESNANKKDLSTPTLSSGSKMSSSVGVTSTSASTFTKDKVGSKSPSSLINGSSTSNKESQISKSSVSSCKSSARNTTRPIPTCTSSQVVGSSTLSRSVVTSNASPSISVSSSLQSSPAVTLSSATARMTLATVSAAGVTASDLPSLMSTCARTSVETAASVTDATTNISLACSLAAVNNQKNNRMVTADSIGLFVTGTPRRENYGINTAVLETNCYADVAPKSLTGAAIAVVTSSPAQSSLAAGGSEAIGISATVDTSVLGPLSTAAAVESVMRGKKEPCSTVSVVDIRPSAHEERGGQFVVTPTSMLPCGALETAVSSSALLSDSATSASSSNARPTDNNASYALVDNVGRMSLDNVCIDAVNRTIPCAVSAVDVNSNNNNNKTTSSAATAVDSNKMNPLLVNSVTKPDNKVVCSPAVASHMEARSNFIPPAIAENTPSSLLVCSGKFPALISPPVSTPSVATSLNTVLFVPQYPRTVKGDTQGNTQAKSKTSSANSISCQASSSKAVVSTSSARTINSVSSVLGKESLGSLVVASKMGSDISASDVGSGLTQAAPSPPKALDVGGLKSKCQTKSINLMGPIASNNSATVALTTPSGGSNNSNTPTTAMRLTNTKSLSSPTAHLLVPSIPLVSQRSGSNRNAQQQQQQSLHGHLLHPSREPQKTSVTSTIESLVSSNLTSSVASSNSISSGPTTSVPSPISSSVLTCKDPISNSSVKSNSSSPQCAFVIAEHAADGQASSKESMSNVIKSPVSTVNATGPTPLVSSVFSSPSPGKTASTATPVYSSTGGNQVLNTSSGRTLSSLPPAKRPSDSDRADVDAKKLVSNVSNFSHEQDANVPATHPDSASIVLAPATSTASSAAFGTRVSTPTKVATLPLCTAGTTGFSATSHCQSYPTPSSSYNTSVAYQSVSHVAAGLTPHAASQESTHATSQASTHATSQASTHATSQVAFHATGMSAHATTSGAASAQASFGQPLHATAGVSGHTTSSSSAQVATTAVKAPTASNINSYSSSGTAVSGTNPFSHFNANHYMSYPFLYHHGGLMSSHGSSPGYSYSGSPCSTPYPYSNNNITNSVTTPATTPTNNVSGYNSSGAINNSVSAASGFDVSSVYNINSNNGGGGSGSACASPAHYSGATPLQPSHQQHLVPTATSAGGDQVSGNTSGSPQAQYASAPQSPQIASSPHASHSPKLPTSPLVQSPKQSPRNANASNKSSPYAQNIYPSYAGYQTPSSGTNACLQATSYPCQVSAASPPTTYSSHIMATHGMYSCLLGSTPSSSQMPSQATTSTTYQSPLSSVAMAQSGMSGYTPKQTTSSISSSTAVAQSLSSPVKASPPHSSSPKLQAAQSCANVFFPHQQYQTPSPNVSPLALNSFNASCLEGATTTTSSSSSKQAFTSSHAALGKVASKAEQASKPSGSVSSKSVLGQQSSVSNSKSSQSHDCPRSIPVNSATSTKEATKSKSSKQNTGGSHTKTKASSSSKSSSSGSSNSTGISSSVDSSQMFQNYQMFNSSPYALSNFMSPNALQQGSNILDPFSAYGFSRNLQASSGGSGTQGSSNANYSNFQAASGRGAAATPDMASGYGSSSYAAASGSHASSKSIVDSRSAAAAAAAAAQYHHYNSGGYFNTSSSAMAGQQDSSSSSSSSSAVNAQAAALNAYLSNINHSSFNSSYAMAANFPYFMPNSFPSMMQSGWNTFPLASSKPSSAGSSMSHSSIDNSGYSSLAAGNSSVNSYPGFYYNQNMGGYSPGSLMSNTASYNSYPYLSMHAFNPALSAAAAAATPAVIKTTTTSSSLHTSDNLTSSYVSSSTTSDKVGHCGKLTQKAGTSAANISKSSSSSSVSSISNSIPMTFSHHPSKNTSSASSNVPASVHSSGWPNPTYHLPSSTQAAMSTTGNSTLQYSSAAKSFTTPILGSVASSPSRISNASAGPSSSAMTAPFLPHSSLSGSSSSETSTAASLYYQAPLSSSSLLNRSEPDAAAAADILSSLSQMVVSSANVISKPARAATVSSSSLRTSSSAPSQTISLACPTTVTTTTTVATTLSQGNKLSTQGVAASTQGVAASTQGVAASTQGVAASTQGVAASTQGVAASTQGVAASTQGVTASTQGVAASTQGVAASTQGVAASTPGVTTPQGVVSTHNISVSTQGTSQALFQTPCSVGRANDFSSSSTISVVPSSVSTTTMSSSQEVVKSSCSVGVPSLSSFSYCSSVLGSPTLKSCTKNGADKTKTLSNSSNLLTQSTYLTTSQSANNNPISAKSSDLATRAECPLTPNSKSSTTKRPIEDTASKGDNGQPVTKKTCSLLTASNSSVGEGSLIGLVSGTVASLTGFADNDRDSTGCHGAQDSAACTLTLKTSAAPQGSSAPTNPSPVNTHTTASSANTSSHDTLKLFPNLSTDSGSSCKETPFSVPTSCVQPANAVLSSSSSFSKVAKSLASIPISVTSIASLSDPSIVDPKASSCPAVNPATKNSNSLIQLPSTESSMLAVPKGKEFKSSNAIEAAKAPTIMKSKPSVPKLVRPSLSSALSKPVTFASKLTISTATITGVSTPLTSILSQSLPNSASSTKAVISPSKTLASTSKPGSMPVNSSSAMAKTVSSPSIVNAVVSSSPKSTVSSSNAPSISVVASSPQATILKPANIKSVVSSIQPTSASQGSQLISTTDSSEAAAAGPSASSEGSSTSELNKVTLSADISRPANRASSCTGSPPDSAPACNVGKAQTLPTNSIIRPNSIASLFPKPPEGTSSMISTTNTSNPGNNTSMKAVPPSPGTQLMVTAAASLTKPSTTTEPPLSSTTKHDPSPTKTVPPQLINKKSNHPPTAANRAASSSAMNTSISTAVVSSLPNSKPMMVSVTIESRTTTATPSSSPTSSISSSVLSSSPATSVSGAPNPVAKTSK